MESVEQPAPREDKRALLYERYVSTHTHASEFSGGGWFPVLKQVPTGSGTRLLDLGCGDGSLLEAAHSGGVEEVRGIDVSREQVELAHALGRDFVSEDEIVAYLARTTWQANCVTTVDVMEHLTSDEVIDVAGAIASYLPVQGLWIGQVPNAVSPFFGNYAYGDLTHRSIFTARSIEQLLAIVGLETMYIGPVGVAPGGGSARRVRRLAFAVVQAALKAALAAETGVRNHIVTQNLIFVGRKPAALASR